MSEKYAIIARYTEGVPKYWIGKKKDSNQPLDDNNVQWKTKDGVPLVFKDYEDARIALG